MRVARIYLDAGLEPGAELELDERAARHLLRVLRCRTGDPVVLFDGRGREARARLVSAHRRHGCIARINEVDEIDRESPLRIELVQALARGDKMDWIVQKAVELGASAIRPVLAERCEVRPDAQGARRKLERWCEIAIAACEQSGRTRLPVVHPIVEPGELKLDPPTRLVLHPDAARPVGRLDAPNGAVAVAVGPEGGFGPGDLECLSTLGFEPVAFGPRVLRSETAGIAAVTALQVLFGDLGNG